MAMVRPAVRHDMKEKLLPTGSTNPGTPSLVIGHSAVVPSHLLAATRTPPVVALPGSAPSSRAAAPGVDLVLGVA